VALFIVKVECFTYVNYCQGALVYYPEEKEEKYFSIKRIGKKVGTKKIWLCGDRNGGISHRRKKDRAAHCVYICGHTPGNNINHNMIILQFNIIGE